MKDQSRVAVTSRSFSRHPVLRAELLDRYEHVTFNDDGASLAGDSLVSFLQGHSKAITALEVIDESIVSNLPQLELISKVGVGIDMIDLEALKRHGVRFSWTAGTNKRSVAELVIGLAIDLLRHVAPSSQDLRAGSWRQPKGRCLSGQTVGIVGCGNVGQEVIRLLQPFGCRILAFDVIDRVEFCNEHGVIPATLEELLSQSDVVSLHVTLNESSRHLLDEDRLKLMKPTAVLINTARGDLVDEAALKASLKTGKLAGAAFDVFATEPPNDDELLNLPTFLATPHIGGSTEEAILAMGRAAIAGLESAAAIDGPGGAGNAGVQPN
jgi:phosphoglycerate dehydrogenase-like enzyme